MEGNRPGQINIGNNITVIYNKIICPYIRLQPFNPSAGTEDLLLVGLGDALQHLVLADEHLLARRILADGDGRLNHINRSNVCIAHRAAERVGADNIGDVKEVLEHIVSEQIVDDDDQASVFTEDDIERVRGLMEQYPELAGLETIEVNARTEAAERSAPEE